MIKTQNRKRIFKTMFIFWSLVILVLTVIPTMESPLPRITFLDKLAHISQFSVFALLYYFLRLEQKTGINKIRKELFILAPILSILPELMQIPIVGRRFCLLDIAANFIGFLLVMIYIDFHKTSKIRTENEKRQEQ